MDNRIARPPKLPPGTITSIEINYISLDGTGNHIILRQQKRGKFLIPKWISPSFEVVEWETLSQAVDWIQEFLSNLGNL